MPAQMLEPSAGFGSLGHAALDRGGLQEREQTLVFFPFPRRSVALDPTRRGAPAVEAEDGTHPFVTVCEFGPWGDGGTHFNSV